MTTPLPPTTAHNTELLSNLNQIIHNTASQILNSATTLNEREFFTSTCLTEMDLRSQLNDTHRRIHRLSKRTQNDNNTSTDNDNCGMDLIDLKIRCQDLEEKLTEAEDRTIAAARPVLDKLLATSLLSSPSNNIGNGNNNNNIDEILTMHTLLAESTASATQNIQQLMDHPHLIEEMVCHGGAKGGNYGRAFELLTDMIHASRCLSSFVFPYGGGPSSNNTDIETEERVVLYNLALGTALEHASSDPITVFDTPSQPIDPVERYLHYENAYLASELDPLLSPFPLATTTRTTKKKGNKNNKPIIYHPSTLFTPWECRYITDSDASNEELSWFRTTLRNYRPDHILNTDYQWRYCQIVRSDVRYQTPDWQGIDRVRPPHKTYRKLVGGGGGKCGPRAWFGRMACKAFGVPTWGIRQPSHAAMCRWTPPPDGDDGDGDSACGKGWVICLGGQSRTNRNGGWHKSYWEGRDAIDFLIEAEARMCSKIVDALTNSSARSAEPGGGDGYCGNIQRGQGLLNTEYGKVLRMRWIGSAMLGEKTQKDYSCNMFDLSCFWYALACVQSKILAQRLSEATATFAGSAMTAPSGCDGGGTAATIVKLHFFKSIIQNSVAIWNDRAATAAGHHANSSSDSIVTDDNREVIIPADSANGRTVKVQPSFDNSYGIRNQIHLSNNHGDKTFEYTVRVPHSGLYGLTAYVVTIHERQKPIRVTVKDSSAASYGDAAGVSIEVPYTSGRWLLTTPVAILLQSGLQTLCFAQVEGSYGVSVKYYKLYLL